MQQVDEVGDVGVHNGLAHQRQRAVSELQRLVHALLLHALAARELLHQSLHITPSTSRHALVRDHPVVDLLRRVLLPPPRAARRVGVVAPAEQTAVGAGDRRRRLHARRAVQPVERVLVARAVPAQVRLAPATQLHRTAGEGHPTLLPVTAHHGVALLQEDGALLARQHLLRLLRVLCVRDVLHVSFLGCRL